MKHLKLIFIFYLTLFFGNNINAQCFNFAKTEGFSKLDTAVYLPDGRLNAITISEGDNLEIYKPFFRGRNYKIVVVCDKNLKELNFKVTNFQKQVLFDSKKQGNTDSWEFKSEKNQNLIIFVEAPASKNSENKTGCIAIIVGFKRRG